VQDADAHNHGSDKKKRNNIDDNNIDVVVPNKELAMLNDNSLQEEPFEIEHDSDSVTLTEIFIDDVLFYQDEYGNRFDSSLNPV